MLVRALTPHPFDAPARRKPVGQTNQRIGATPKTALADTEAVPPEIPRNRDGTLCRSAHGERQRYSTRSTIVNAAHTA
jgi:hypothetical protein